jgi:SAM-dependent methyltransferase
MSFDYLFGLVIAGCVIFLGYHILVYARTKVPIISTPKKYLKNLMGELKINENSVIYELGSGNGDFAFEIAELKPKKIVGFELSPLHVLYCKLKAKLTKSRADFFTKDFFEEDLSDADIVYFYLVPKVARKAWDKMLSDCEPGTLVVQYGSKIIDIEPARSIPADPNDEDAPHFNFYRV